jgi:flagellar motor component MotA
MRVLSVVSYVFSGLLLYLSFWIAEGSNFNLLSFWDLSSLLTIIASFFIILVNFRFSEIYNAIFDALSKTNRQGFEERYELNKIIINSIGSYSLFSSILASIVALIITLGNLADTSKLGVSIAIILIVMLYAIIVRLFFVIPLNISLDKKMVKVVK